MISVTNSLVGKSNTSAARPMDLDPCFAKPMGSGPSVGFWFWFGETRCFFWSGVWRTSNFGTSTPRLKRDVDSALEAMAAPKVG